MDHTLRPIPMTDRITKNIMPAGAGRTGRDTRYMIQGIRIVEIPTIGIKSKSAIRNATVSGLGTDAATISTDISARVISIINEYDAKYFIIVLKKLFLAIDVVK